MPSAGRDDSASLEGEPWSLRLWLGLAVVVIVTTSLCSYGISTWPMADDEVPSLVEMGLVSVSPEAFSVPAGQIGRLPRAMPVWYGFQRTALTWLPANEFGFRLPSLICAVLTSALAFVLAARWRGLWFAAALALVVNGSQMFVFLAQVDRFYSMPLLLLVVTLAVMTVPGRSFPMLLVTAALAALTVLSHNLTVAVFGLAFLAAGTAWLVDRAPATLVLRSGIAAAVAVSLYFLYIRPLIQGWASTGNPTPVLVSFAAHAGVPVIAFALLGVWLIVSYRNSAPGMLWWAVLFLGSLVFFPLAPVSWNPRYFFFFMPAMWILAAYAVEHVARVVGYRWTGAAWYGCVLALLLPALLSHLRDGSRHDYRAAAAVLSSHARPGQTILSDDAETISYYLPSTLKEQLHVRTKVVEYPRSEFYLVTRANAWAPLPQTPGRKMSVLAEIARRRYDQFSHILRVYRVDAALAD